MGILKKKSKVEVPEETKVTVNLDVDPNDPRK